MTEDDRTGAGGSATAIRVGVAGWDYGDWQGVVYPARTGARFDRLAYLARYVDLIEVNSTFYRPALPRTAESWLRRTAARPRLLFTAKAHRSWTHEPRPDLDAAVPQTLDGLTPLRAAGRLGAVLVQFPHSFHWSAPARERLERIAERARGWPLVVEVRHTSWRGEEVSGWLGERSLGWCAVDQPRVGGTTLGLVPRVTGGCGYVRLHGRKAADWFRPDAGRDARYDYLYAREELADIVEPVRRMASEAAQVFVVQNNHFRGQALANALQLRRMLEGRRPAAPPDLVAVYPALEPDVDAERTRLF